LPFSLPLQLPLPPTTTSSSPDFFCVHCDHFFISLIGLVGHLRIHRMEAGEPVPEAPTYSHRVRLHCSHCSRTFAYHMGLLEPIMSELLSHRLSQHQRRSAIDEALYLLRVEPSSSHINVNVLKIEEMERLTEHPTHVTMAIQTNTNEEALEGPPAKGRGKKAQQPPSPAQPQTNSAARRRARRQAAAKAAAAAALRRNRMVETDVQTCPPDHRVCPWCTLDIPPEAQCGHEEVCKAGFKQRERRAKVEAQLVQHRLAVENARRRKRGLAPKKPTDGPSKTTTTRARNSSRSLSRTRSRSRTRSVDAHLSATLKRQALLNAQLERVHPNDVDGMVHATHRVCSLVDCPRLLGGAGGPCVYCKLLFCPQHRPPHSGHDCKLAPPPPPEPASPETENGKVSMACGEDYEERKLALRSRLRDKLKTLADKRQR
uniref:C2H2-type domain-containing protein n=2 Tax=Schistocephalus solidus TaxID=70667 RepID=A0A183SNQ9_SCHSO